jgi:hypothetical protein
MIFKSSIEALEKKLADAMVNAEVARSALDAATAAETRTCADVETRSRGGVTTPADQLLVVQARRARLEAEDGTRRAELVRDADAHALAIARKDPDALARDPGALLADLTKIWKMIAQHRAALDTAYKAWAERLRTAFQSVECARLDDGARPVPLPAMTDDIGRSLSADRYLDELRGSIARNEDPSPSSDQIEMLRRREAELRKTIERQDREEQERARARREYAALERKKHSDAHASHDTNADPFR